MSTPALRLDWCSQEAARYACAKWHYSGSLPTPPVVKIGVWEDGRFIGCVLFSRGATQHIGRPFGLPQTEVAELTRVALAAHAAPVSRIISIAVRLLGRTAALRLLVSYADPGHHHHGGIYQAAGWFYLGQGEATTEYVDPNGRRWHGRMVSPSGRKRVYGQYRAVVRPDQCAPVVCPGKHKYALPLDAALRRRLAPLAAPYPRRALSGRASGESDTPAAQAGEGAAMRPHGSPPPLEAAG
jgi:hypothetical protein